MHKELLKKVYFWRLKWFAAILIDTTVAIMHINGAQNVADTLYIDIAFSSSYCYRYLAAAAFIVVSTH